MTRGTWFHARLFLGLGLAACGGGGSTGPDTGNLQVAVSGLPAGTLASVTVTGPGGYSHALGASETLAELAPGSYTVAAAGVTGGASLYTASPASQSVTVSGGNTAASTVTYSVASGALTVTVSGLPGGAEAAVLVTGPGGFSQEVAVTRTLDALLPGSYTVTAQPVAAGSTQYGGTPGTQQVAVAVGTTASAAVTYTETPSSGLNYRIDGVYLTQSVQTFAGDVPLVANRDAFLRVFVTASQANAVSPEVRVRFYQGATLASTQTITRAGTTPLAPQEGTLGSSWNLAVSKTLITPSLAIVVDVDPANSFAETNELDNVFPASGTPVALDVRTAPQFRVTLVPVVTSVDGRTGNVTSGNKDQYVATAMRMHPLSSFDAAVGAPLTVPATVPALQSDNGNNAWNQVLGQLQTRRVSDGSSRYYYGVVNPAYGSGVAGMGYVGFPVAIGWDKLPSAAAVSAHEWGHNWNRQHAPCGGASGPDLDYPYSGGAIGVTGYDVQNGLLKPATSHDLMGYCDNEWISDYTYKGVMQYRSSGADVASAVGEAIQPALVVWGRIENGEPVLEPAFQAATRPSLPRRGGPFHLEARSGDGARVFALDFAPLEIADDPRAGRHFAFAVPLTPERGARIDHISLSGEGRSTTMAASAAGEPRVQVGKSDRGRLTLTWDAAKHPMVVVRDPRNGQILSFARGGRAEVAVDQPDVSLTVSDRVRSRDLRVRVPSR